MVEEWRVIEAHKNYEVSTHGRIRRIRSGMGATVGRVLKATATTTCPYLAVSLYEKDIRSVRLVHILVVETFIGAPPTPSHQVNHIDADKANPRLDNLEYVTPLENMGHAKLLDLCPKGIRNGTNILTEAEVGKIRELLAERMVQKSIATIFGVSQSTISHINTRRQWGWL